MSCLFMIGQQDVAHIFINVDCSDFNFDSKNKNKNESGSNNNNDENDGDSDGDSGDSDNHIYGNILHRLVYGMAHVCCHDPTSTANQSLSQAHAPSHSSQPPFRDTRSVPWRKRPTECHQILLTCLLNLINQVTQVSQGSRPTTNGSSGMITGSSGSQKSHENGSMGLLPGLVYGTLVDLQGYCTSSGLTEYVIEHYMLHPVNQILRIYGLKVMSALYVGCRAQSGITSEFAQLISKYNWKVMDFV